MRWHAESTCDVHPDRFDCADALVHYSAVRGDYGLIVHDGGSSFIVMAYCPWCGVELPRAPDDDPGERVIEV
jgi:hypothetical protein